jgi:type II secretory pathway predicted ATPase ExeA
MNRPATVDMLLKAVWGASAPPFAEACATPYEAPTFLDTLDRLEQMLRLRASGVLHGPNGTGKSLLLDGLLDRLSDKEFLAVKHAHASVTGPDLLRSLCRAYGLEPSIRRSDNVHRLLKHWQTLAALHPVVVIDEAQQLDSRALEELRLLCADRTRLTGRDRIAPFSLLLCGDQDLLPTLAMGVHRALRSRLGFCLATTPLSEEQTAHYVMHRWSEVGVRTCPFDAAALTLLHHAAAGVPRTINQIGALATSAAACGKSSAIGSQHVQEAIAQLPWLGADARGA